jgi:hypothetical protein
MARFLLLLTSVGIYLALVSAAPAQSPIVNSVAAQSPAALSQSAVLVSTASGKVVESPPRQAPVGPMPSLQAAPNEHPLMPVLRWAQQGLPAIEHLKDYSATLVSRERIRGKLGSYQYMFIKIRHTPLSVYVRFLSPLSVQGQEAIYVAGQNHGNLLGHRGNSGVTASLDPEGAIAMNDRHYPLTEIGIANLVRRLAEVGQQDTRYGECEVKYFRDVKVDKRPSTVIQVTHPVPRDVFRFHLARVFIDDQLMMPIRYESYDWSTESGGAPRLIEEYTYLNLKLNNGFTDEDFSVRNPEYHFERGAAEPVTAR